MKFYKFFIFTSIALVCAFLYKSIFGYWADSEVWAVTLSKQKFFSFEGTELIPSDSIGLYFKPLHHILIKFTYVAFPQSWNILIINRIFGFLIGIGIAAVYARIFSEILNNKRGWVLGFVAILTVTLFFERGYRIRADLLASLFHGLILFEFFRMQKQKDPWEIRISTAILVLYELAFVLSTVKYLPVLFLLNILYFFLLIGSSKELYWVRFYKNKFLIQFVLIFVGVVFIHINRPLFFAQYIGELITYSLEAVTSSPADQNIQYIHILRWITGNPILWASYIGMVLFTVFRLLAPQGSSTVEQKNRSLLTLYSLLLMIFILNAPEKHAYFVASCSPLFTILSLSYLVSISNNLAKQYKWKISGFQTVGLLLICKFLVLLIIYKDQWTNQDQRAYQASLKQYLVENNISLYYDPIGILPRHMLFYAFLGPNQDMENKIAIEKIMHYQPEMIICTAKCNYFPGNWVDMFSRLYNYNAPNVLIRKDIKAAPFKNPTGKKEQELFRYDI